jgi:acetolactate synthase-1/2/3 large subunit
MATVADRVISRLREAGVQALFGVPGGGSNLDLIDAAGRARLPFVLTATETGGALAAMAQAEITSQPGACLTTLGPGAASVINGVACAFLDRAPLVVFTDSHPVVAHAHQRLDHAALFAPITKASTSLSPDHVDRVLAEALATATAPRPGPVHVDCPGDVAGAPIGASDGAVAVRLPPPGTGKTPDALDALLERSRRPLLLVGLGARRPVDAAAIRALCTRRRVPAMVTYKAKGVVPDAHPLFAGVFTNAAIERPLIDESDLLIGVGLDPVELIPRPWTHAAPVVYCGAWAVGVGHVPFAVEWVTEVATAVEYVDARLRSSEWDLDRLRDSVVQQRRAINVPAEGLTAQRVVQIAAEALAPTSRVTVDAGAHMFAATTLWPVEEPNGMLIANGLSTMGFALPAAIGAALLDRDRPTVALTGDGGLLMCVGELLTAVRERLRILVIVFSDGSLSLIEIKQQARRLPPAGVALGAIAWPALAASLGVTPFVAATERELAYAIAQARACPGPSLLEVRIDRSNYGATLRAVRG